MKSELHFKTTCKNKWYCYAALFFLLFANQTFGQTTRYVQAGYGMDMGDCTGAIPCATIGYAIGQSGSGDVIEIANGTYTESITIDKELTLNGESENGAIIQAAEAPGIAENRVIFVSPGSGSEVSLSNLTIRYGSIVGSGAGIFHDSGSILNISNVTIRENKVIYDENVYVGGGLYSKGRSNLNNVTFSDNTAHGGAGMLCFGTNTEVILTNVVFENNIATAYGGGLSVQQGCSSTLTDVSFIGNQANDGAGIHNIFNSAQQVYKNVTFTNNVATQYGGGLYSDSSTSPQLVNVIFSGNSAETGGAIGFFAPMTPSTFTNVTISNNTATSQGGGIYVFFGGEGMNISNSIIWNNTSEGEEGNEIYNPSGTTNISYSLYKNDSNDIVGAINSSNSLIEDPLFVDAGNGLFQLSNESPGINTGNPDTDLSLFPGGPDDPLDLDNNPRVFGGVIDIGAYENQTTLPSCGAPTDVLVDNVTSTSAYVSWTENGDASAWEIEYGESGFIQGEGTVILDNNGILGETLTDLVSATEYDVYVRAICDDGASDWAGPVTFNTQEMGTIEFDNQITLYPNPTTGIINLQSKEKINSVLVYNLTGQRMSIKSLNKENTSIDISGLSNGIYFVEVILNDKTIKRHKVIKK